MNIITIGQYSSAVLMAISLILFLLGTHKPAYFIGAVAFLVLGITGIAKGELSAIAAFLLAAVAIEKLLQG